MDCEVLFLGASSWNKGKLRVNAKIEIQEDKEVGQGYHITYEKNNKRLKINFDEIAIIKVSIEFASENPNFFLPEMPESPLDEIRQQMRKEQINET